MGILDKISKFFEEIGDERDRRWREKQEERRQEEEKKRASDELKSKYYNAWLHNFILDCKGHFDHVNEDGDYDDKFQKEYDKLYRNINNDRVSVPEVPFGAFEMEEVFEDAQSEDEDYTHEEWNYDYCYNSVEYDKGRPFYNPTHIFIDMLLHRSKYKEIMYLMNSENYDALWEIKNVLQSKLYEDQDLFERD